MKIGRLVTTTLILLITSTSWAETAYLSVPQWESCTVSYNKGPYKFFCLPPKKPDACPASSWSTLNKGQLLPFCPLCPPSKFTNVINKPNQ